MARKDICIECSKLGRVTLLVDGSDDKPVCQNCYVRIYQKKKKCFDCGNVSRVANNLPEGPICFSCYYKRFPPKKRQCALCGEIGKIVKNDNGMSICSRCFNKNRKRKEICGKCMKLRDICYVVDDMRLCRTCGMKATGKKNAPRKKETCFKCGKNRTVSKRNDDGSAVCSLCFEKDRMDTDPVFRLQRRLRTRVNDAFRRYSRTGKIRKSSGYGIDYRKIIDYLGPRPDSEQNWQVDHIFPLSAFDFNDLGQIKKAFSPENHRWMLAKENRQKSASFDKEELAAFLAA